ncbi:hypothetical protein V6N13_025535 [Hibiscus sabdariffa]|uniref:RNase H type-1 domain-containing protein n=1 Tax=Hibiscus sabdariffa TaxID=183260 RepID=A0ABR2P8E8_9ROSI
MTMDSKIPYPLHWHKELTSSMPRDNGPPPPGVVKVNCDASFDASLNILGIAIVFRDSSGSIISGANMKVFTSFGHHCKGISMQIGT